VKNICSCGGGAQEKWKTGSKPGWNSVWHKRWCISEFDPPLKAKVLFFWRFLKISPGFGPNSGVLVPYFPDFTENLTKHPENRSPYVLIPLKIKKKISTDTLLGLQRVDSRLGESWQSGFQKGYHFIWKPPKWESEWRPWRFSLKKWEPPNTGFNTGFNQIPSTHC
jgi:hypothetical protein